MPTSVDERVVRMDFDNAKFESGVQKTLATLDKLKDALKLKGASDGLDNISKTSNNFSLDSMGNAIQSINDKFTALGIVGFNVLSNLANKAIDTGVKMVKALSVDQITAGWNKFSQKTNSVATLVAQGYALEEVNEQMERLNWYTDETSYNYVDMANNIAKFTATGQDLTSSVTAMMGIANWAALSGQNATKASLAMYQLSQAMSKGALRYDDWKSIQNASMDSKEFREHALAAAEALGTVKKNLDGTYRAGKKNYTLNEMFSSEAMTRSNWFTSDVMMKVFTEYAGAVDQLYEHTKEFGGTASQAIEDLGDDIDAFALKAFKAGQEARSWQDAVDAVKDAVSTGWMKTFEYIFGNYDQATKLWTSLANNLFEVFMFGTERRNALFEGWNALGGHARMLNTLENSFETLLNIMNAVRDAFYSVFPKIVSGDLYNITVKLEQFSEKLKDNEELVENVKTVFTGFFSIINIIRKALTATGKKVIQIVKSILTFISPLTDQIKPLVLRFSEWVTQLDKGEVKFEKFKNVLDAIKEKLAPIGDIFNKAKESVKNFFDIFTKRDKNTEDTSEDVKSISDRISEAADKIGNATSKFAKFSNFFEKLKGVLSNAAEGIKTAFSKVNDAFSKSDGKIATNFINTGFIGIITIALKQFIDNLTGAAGEAKGVFSAFKNIGENINKIFTSLSDSLKTLQNSVKAKVLKQIAVSIAILAASVFALALIDPVRLSFSLKALAALFIEVGTFVTIFDKINKASNPKTTNKLSTSLIKVAAAVLILSIAMKKLSTMSLDEIGRGLLAITGLLTVVTASAIFLSKFGQTASKGINGMVKFSIAVAILGAVMKSLSTLSLNELGVGLLSVLGLVGIMTGAAILLSKFAGKFTKGAFGMILFASAIAILAKVMQSFYNVDIEQIGKGLLAVGGLAVILSGTLALAGLAKHIITSAVAFLIISAAMAIFTKVMASFAELSWEQIGKAFTLFGGIMAIVTVMSIILGKTGMVVSLLAISAALTIFAVAMQIFQSAFSKMGKMEWSQIGKAFLVLGGSLLIIGGAAALLSNFIPAILGFAGAIALLGLGLQLIATAVVTFNLADLIHKIAKGAEGLAAQLRSGMFLNIFKNILEALKELVKFIPLFIAAFVQGLIDGFTLIVNSQNKLIPALVKFGIMILTVLDTLLPKLVGFGLRMILSILKGIDEHIEQITTVAGSIITHFLIGLSYALPMIIMGATILMYNFIIGMAEAIRMYQDLIFAAEKDLLSAIIEFAIAAIQELVELIPGVGKKWAEGLEEAKNKVRATLAPEELEPISSAAAQGLIDGFKGKADEVEAAGEDAAKAGTSGIQNILGMFTGSGEDSTSAFAEGLLNNLNISGVAGSDVGEEAAENMENGGFEDAGLEAVKGFARGINNNSYLAENAATNLGSRVSKAFKNRLEIKSPSKVFEKDGYYTIQGYANGLNKFSYIVEDATTDVGDKAIYSMSEAIAKIDDYLMKNMDASPTIRPVFDMSSVEQGVGILDDLMDRSYTFSNTSSKLASQNARLFSLNKDRNIATDSNKAVVNAIGNLHTDIDNLGKSIEGMGFYMDGKKVGKIVSPTVNRTLYTDSIRKGRNN